MLKRCLVTAFCLTFASSLLHAQALPAASRAGILQVGGGVTSANPDYSQKRIAGVTGYATYDFLSHVGLEADFHVLSFFTPDDIGENSYEFGPRFVYRRGRFEPYAKVMIGLTSQTFQTPSYNPSRSQSYMDYAFGGGLDIRFEHHINVRAIDFEQQIWPTYSPNNLSPSLITIGVAYRLR